MRQTPKKIFLELIVALVTVVFGLSQVARAGNPFYPIAMVYYSNSGVKTSGDATTANSFATAYSYRNTTDGNPSSWIASNFGISQSPGYNKIYAAGEKAGDPAYTLWDTGSTSWTFTPQVGDDDVIVLMTKNGLNNWGGTSWVGGSRVTLTTAMVGNANAEFRDVVMEPIPTPVLQSSTTSSITMRWQGLWDNTTGASGGNGTASVVGYTIYRSVDGGAYASYASINQSAGNTISYTDNGVANGHTYTYKLGVRFIWTAHTGGYYEPDAQGPASATMSTSLPQPVMTKFISAAPSFTAGSSSSIQTLQSTDAFGNATNVVGNTSVALSTSSTGVNAKFYAVSGGVCTTTVITTVTITTGTNTAQFCYYDEKAGSWTLKSSVASWSDGTQTATVTSGTTLGSLALALNSPQKSRVSLTGTNTITARDTYGNTMTGFSAASDPITVSISPVATLAGLNGTGNSQLTLGSDFVNGIASLAGRLKISGTAGSYTLTATSGSGKTISTSVTLTAGLLDHFTFSLSSPQTIGAAFTGSNTLTAYDADNNIITDFNAQTTNVAITENAGSGTVSGLGSGVNNVLNQSTSFVNGVANLSAMKYIGTSSAHTFKATAGTATGTSSSVMFSVGSFNKFGWTISSPQTNGQLFSTATLTAQDSGGNTVTNYDASSNVVNLSVSGTGSLNLTQLSNAGSFVNGVATLSSTLGFTGAAGTHTLTATSANGKSGSTSFTTTAGAVQSVKIVNGDTAAATEVTDVSLTADQSLTLYSAGYDESGNWTGLVLEVWSSDEALAPAINTSEVNSITFTPTIAPTSGKITIASGGMNDATGTISVSAGSVHHLIVTPVLPVVAGLQFNVTMTAVDMDGNVVSGFSGTKSIVLSGPGNSPNGQAPQYPTTATFSGGLATVPVTLFNAANTTVTVSQGGLSGATSEFSVAAANSATLQVNGPPTIKAGQPFTVSLRALDTYGNLTSAYSGTKSIVLSGPGNSPNGQAPQYPTTVGFTNGVASASVTLYKKEAAALKAVIETLNGTSSSITVSTGDAAILEKVSGDNQSGPVSQLLAQPLVVRVKDIYQNPKEQYPLQVVVANGGGSVSNVAPQTADDGTAQILWTLGSSPGENNNTVTISAGSLTGSPATFTASANGNGFVVTAPSKVTAGVAFGISIKVVDVNGQTVTSYNGTKTISFTGPNAAPDGTAPIYPVSVTFVNGVATPSPNITLVAPETTTLTMRDGALSGTSSQITVAVGAPAKLAISTPIQQIKAGALSSAMTVCLQDQFGNATTTGQERTLTLSTTSSSGQFSGSSDGPWPQYQLTIPTGVSCVDVYYKDNAAGAKTLTFTSNALTESTQGIIILPTDGSSSSGSGSNTTTIINNTTTNNTIKEVYDRERTITVYIDRPTTAMSQASSGEKTTIPLPQTILPTITSPGNGAIVAPFSNNIIIAGTSISGTTVHIKSPYNQSIAAATSDSNGNWQVYIDRAKFVSPYQTIVAEVAVNNVQSAPVSFMIKDETWLERFIRWWEQ